MRRQAEEANMITEKVAVIGIGYVGLPLAAAFSRAGFSTIAYDISAERISQLAKGWDSTGAFTHEQLIEAGVRFTSSLAELLECTCFIITVPTPLNADKTPDLEPLTSACEDVSRVLRPGGMVVVESTVYPGATRGVCKERLEKSSGLTCGTDFFLAYSPERINPGDTEHSLNDVTKLVAGYNHQASARATSLYRKIIPAGVRELPSLEAAELAKTVENSQRDLNIAFSNEISQICEVLGIDVRVVLDACATKWNFQPFTPGLVGGHCIPVDPYYLIHRSETAGYSPSLLLSARHTNEAMPRFLAEQLVKNLDGIGTPLGEARVAILGATFKPDVPDMRNSGVVEFIRELQILGVAPVVHDPLMADCDMRAAFGNRSVPITSLHDLDMLVLAVAHREYIPCLSEILHGALTPGAMFVDLTRSTTKETLPIDTRYWSL